MHPLISLNRTGNDRSFKSLSDWGKGMFKHMHNKGFLFEVWSPISDFGRGSWQCMKQPSPTVFHSDRQYRLYSPDGQHAHLGISHLRPTTKVSLGQVTKLDNKLAIGVEGKDAYVMQLTVIA